MRFRAQDRGDGVFALEPPRGLLGVVGHELPLSVPPMDGGAQKGRFGWVSGVCESPNRADRYVVEFLGKREFRILAYIDRYGRAFTTSEPVAMPPARRPDLEFARFPEQSDEDEERGCVSVREGMGMRQVAQYLFKHGHYRLSDSWYDFGAYAAGLSYSDVMARAYLAFVYRPTHGGLQVPARGLGSVVADLRGDHPISAMREIVSLVEGARKDPALRPPALLSCLARWLDEAGFAQVEERHVPDEALRLVRTKRYADTFYLSCGEYDGAEGALPREELWGIESALNRFLLIGDELGEAASSAGERECLQADERLFETVGGEVPAPGLGSTMPEGAEDGEWELRCAICSALERLRLPVRMEMDLRLDAPSGVAAFELRVPDARFMQRERWADAEAPGDEEGARPASSADREAQARRYAMHLGLAAALAAFRASPSIGRADVTARPFRERDKKPQDPELLRGEDEGEKVESRRAYFRVSFAREDFSDALALSIAQSGDPTFMFERAGAAFDSVTTDAFAVVSGLESTARRRQLPERLDAPVPAGCRKALGAEESAGLRIECEAYRRRVGERLADRIAQSDTVTEAMHIVREEQAAALERGDAETADACTRLMSALAEGSVDEGDQNELVLRFLGEDRCLTAISRARATAKGDPEAAVELLMDAVAEASALDGYVDGRRTAFRYFDSYASRLAYNLALARARERKEEDSPDQVDPSPHENIPCLESVAASDVDRGLSLVPDSFYLCHLQIVHLLERSFERSEDALRYGRRAIEMAPATSAGYRQLGRAFMLTGDMENADAALRSGLAVAVQPNDVAVAYYQLAYVLWKRGDEKAACACYLKSLDVSPVVALQASAELHELIGESQEQLPLKGQVDEALEESGVPVAPSAQVLDALEAGAVAAVDAGFFPVARNLLSLRLHYRPDDALVKVLHSLEDPADR